ncbi:hypothetical protein V8E51_015897 [Hyaloscypha variabilis]
MDPVSAFGLAASVVQFIDFTERLLRGTYYIYKSATTTGDTKINFDLITVTSSLKTLNEDLQSSLIRETADGRTIPKSEQEIGKICKDCSELADQLISGLEKLRLQRQDDLWESFRRALQTIWSKKQIESLEKRLEAFRMHLMLQINASLRTRVELMQATQLSQGHLISTSLQVAQEVRRNLLKQMDQNALWQQKVIDTIISNMDLGSQSVLTVWNRNELLSNPDNSVYKDFTIRFHTHLLRSLRFEDMHRRAKGVVHPYSQTYEWIYSDSSETSASNFVKFLEGTQNLFWITGKPASGKSTLMKMISDDNRTIDHLGTWAAGEGLFVSRFYFWCSGTEMQMSQEGLLRTLLYEALELLPHLAPIIFPHRMENFVVFGNGVGFEAPWDVTELMEAYQQLVLEITKSKRMFLLIDGLDEFKGDNSEQTKLIDFLHGLLSLSSNIKACVSSRPWNIFADAFHTRPSLRVEDLTYPDIQHYVSSNLSENLGFAALQRGHTELASSLINKVSKKASGVFLWVVLVVRSLLQGLTDGERLSDLQKRLDSLPPDIETLVWKILKSVDFTRVSQLIQIVELALESDGQALTAIQLFYADEDDIEFAFQMQIPTDNIRHARFSSNSEMIRRRLNACSKGLLELQKGDCELLADATVQYLHRTVRDFIQREEIWSKLREATTTSPTPDLRLAASTLACFKMGYVKATPNGTRNGDVFWISLMASMVNIHRHSPSMELPRFFDELEKSAEIILASSSPTRRMTYENCPLTQQSDHVAISSFLQLAVKLQLDGYVKHKVLFLFNTGRLRNFQSLFQMAVTDYQTVHPLFRRSSPSLPLIERFLDLELKPSQPLLMGGSIVPLHSDTIWQFVISDSGQRPEMIKLFLRYGADPFLKELDALYFHQDGGDLRECLEEARRKATKKGTKERSSSKMTSSWPRVIKARLTGERKE